MNYDGTNEIKLYFIKKNAKVYKFKLDYKQKLICNFIEMLKYRQYY